jgi:BirA family biotin operon repressor/biotin-[acetyl-CoA-carboxylase] ligase
VSTHLPYNIICLKTVSSTNDYARDLIEEKSPAEGTVILADYQTKGKGHDGNTWESKAGENLLMSIILYPEFLEVSKQFSLSMAVSLGITDALKEMLPGAKFSLKWPNDIYHGNNKLGGILINTEIIGERFNYVIAGIGLNVNQVNFSSGIPNPVSLCHIADHKFVPGELAEILAARIMERILMLKSSPGNIRKEYHDKLLGFNQERHFIYRGANMKAVIKGVNEFGHLILESGHHTHYCDLKEVTFVF